jgi:hypothetical protein
MRSKWFLSLCYIWRKPCSYLAPTRTLSPKGPKWDSTWPMSPRSSIGCVQNDFRAYGTFSANRAPILRQDLHYLQIDRIELSLDPSHLEVSLGASKMISEHMVCFAQTVHLSCTDTNIVSKCAKTKFHMTHITQEFNQVRPTRFLSLWYIWHKTCACLALIIALSPNRPKWASTGASSPRCTISCVQNNFWGYGTFGANRAPILHWH